MIFCIKGHLVVSLGLLSKPDCVVDSVFPVPCLPIFQKTSPRQHLSCRREQCLTIKWTSPVNVLQLSFSRLKQFPSVPSWLRIFFFKIRNGYQISSEFFCICWAVCRMFSFNPLVWWITFIDFTLLNQFGIPRINAIWSWYLILFILPGKTVNSFEMDRKDYLVFSMEK